MAIQTTAKTNNSKLKDEKVPEKQNLKVESRGNSSSSNPERADEMVLEINPNIVIGIVLVVLAIIIGIFIFRTPDQTPVTPTTFGESLVDAKTRIDGFARGVETAPITVVEYSDYECPYCKMHATGYDPRTGITAAKSVMQKIIEEYVDKGIVRYVYKPYTAVSTHNPAFNNEWVGTLCADEQGKFWEFHEQVFKKSQGDGLGIDGRGANEDAIVAIASDLKLDTTKFKNCYSKRNIGELNTVNDYMKNVIKPEYDKKKLQIGTPIFFICKIPTNGDKECVGKSFAGAETFENFSAVIELVRTGGTLTPTPTISK